MTETNTGPIEVYDPEQFTSGHGAAGNCSHKNQHDKDPDKWGTDPTAQYQRQKQNGKYEALCEEHAIALADSAEELAAAIGSEPPDQTEQAAGRGRQPKDEGPYPVADDGVLRHPIGGQFMDRIDQWLDDKITPDVMRRIKATERKRGSGRGYYLETNDPADLVELAEMFGKLAEAADHGGAVGDRNLFLRNQQAANQTAELLTSHAVDNGAEAVTSS